MGDFHSLGNLSRIRVGLIVLAFGSALIAFKVAGEPLPSTLKVVDPPHQTNPPSLFVATSSFDLPKLLAAELDKLDREFPQETVQQVQADVDRYCKIGNGNDGRLVSLITALRYMRDKRLFDHQQFNPAIQKQLSALTDGNL